MIREIVKIFYCSMERTSKFRGVRGTVFQSLGVKPPRRKVKKVSQALSEAQLKRLNTAKDILLGLLAVGGVLAVAVLAPNALMLLNDRSRRSYHRKRSKVSSRSEFTIARAAYYLKKQGLVRFKHDRLRGWIAKLTALGRKSVSDLRLKSLSITHPRRWDGKWWLIAADIPTKSHRQGADLLRRKLKALGFYPLQRTLWMHPFDPRKEIEFVASHYQVGRYVTVMEVNRLDVDDARRLKKFFHPDRPSFFQAKSSKE